MDVQDPQVAISTFSNQATRSWQRKVDLPGTTTLSLIAESFEPHVIRIWRPNRIHEYLLAPDHRRHAWHSWLGSADRQTFDTDTYRFLSQARSRDVVADAYSCCPPGLISALGKLGAQARRKEFYAALVGVLKRGGPLARHVHHLKQISDETIFSLAAIDDDPPSDRVLKALLKRSKPHQYTELVWIVGRLSLLLGENEVEVSIVTGGNPARTVETLIAQLPFPEPPFAGEPRLQPITSANELGKVGKDFRNCLADPRTWFDAVIEVQAGQTYFYQWNGDQPALLSFGRYGSLGWIPTQIEAVNSESPCEITQSEVERVFRKIPEIGPISMRCGYRY